MLDLLMAAYVHTIHDNAAKITESAKYGTKVYVQQDYHSAVGMKCTINYGCESLKFVLH